VDIEWATLCKAVESGDFRALLDARIRTSYFQDPDNAQVFRWMQTFWTDHSASPTEGALHHEFPNYALVETPEPLSWYLDELRDAHRYSLVIEILDQVREPLKRSDANTALKVLAHGLENAHTEVSDLSDEDFTLTAQDRLEHYENLRGTKHMQGIPTGFPTMDLATSGLQPEQLITIIGTTKVGKSAIAMKMAISAHQAGYRPLFTTFEMSNEEQAVRHDSLRAGVSWNRLANGKLTRAEKHRLTKMLHGLDGMPPMVFVHDPSSTTTVSALAAKLSLHKPDALFVDGAYLMDADDPGVIPNSPQALTAITRSMKRLAQRAKVPIVMTTQALTWKSKKGLTTDSVGYSSSFAQDSDVIFGVEEIKGYEEERTLKIIAARNTGPRSVRLRMDFNTGTIMELEEIEFASDDELDDEEEM
jgi:archaellum biogenesis ATPase FlaH